MTATARCSTRSTASGRSLPASGHACGSRRRSTVAEHCGCPGTGTAYEDPESRGSRAGRSGWEDREWGRRTGRSRHMGTGTPLRLPHDGGVLPHGVDRRVDGRGAAGPGGPRRDDLLLCPGRGGATVTTASPQRTRPASMLRASGAAGWRWRVSGAAGRADCQASTPRRAPRCAPIVASPRPSTRTTKRRRPPT